MKNNKTTQIVISAMFAALCCVATMIIKIPSPLKGYINLGDCIVLLSGFMLSPLYGFLAAGIGSAFADILSGYVIYAPATFIIKGIMALVVCYVCKSLHSMNLPTFSRIIASVTAEIIMVIGYFVFEGFMYGFAASAVNIPANAVQGVAGIFLGIILCKIFDTRFSLK